MLFIDIVTIERIVLI